MAIFSLFFANGPNVRDTYAPGSLLSSFWGSRNLHPEVKKAALATEDQKTVGLTRKESVKGTAALASSISQSNTASIQNSNVPLNQVIC